jgi:hypothetical protein
MSTTRIRLALLSATLAFVTITSHAATVVCHKESIQGFDKEHQVATFLLGAATTEISHCKIYITAAEGKFLYVHSNYIGPESGYAAKIATDEPLDLETLVLNLVFQDYPTTNELVILRQAITNDMHFYVDRDALAGTLFTNLDLSKCKNVDWDPPRARNADVTHQSYDLRAQAALPGNNPPTSSTRAPSSPPRERAGSAPPTATPNSASTQSIFQIATNISTPLALAGFVAAVLFFILNRILSLNLFPQLTAHISSAILKLIINRLFILSLVAMVLGFLGFALVKLKR